MTFLIKLLNQADSWLGRIEVVFLSGGILLMAANTIANVFGRYLFSNSIYFSEELNQIIMVTVTFMGLGYVTRKGRHIRMSAIYDVLHDKHKKLLMLVITATTAVVLFMLCYYASLYVGKVARRGIVTAALQIPMYWTLLVVPVGFFIAAMQYVLAFIKNLQSADIYLSYIALDVYDEEHSNQSV